LKKQFGLAIMGFVSEGGNGVAKPNVIVKHCVLAIKGFFNSHKHVPVREQDPTVESNVCIFKKLLW